MEPVSSSTVFTILLDRVLMSFSVSVFSSDCITTLNASDFFPLGIFSPSYKSKTEIVSDFLYA